MTIDRPRAAHIPQLRSLWTEAFGDGGEYLDLFFTHAFAEDRCLCIFSDDAPVCAVYWFGCEYQGQKLAYLYALATAKSCRGRGYARKLMSAAHEALTRQNYRGCLLVPGEESLFSLYAAMGYRRCCSRREFTCEAGGEAAALGLVDAAEYARLRRKLLPPGSVVQEGENLEFLHAQAQLFAGEDFLLAALGQQDALVGLELLGDTRQAPNILQALGCTQGSFRTPGAGKHPAMYLPLHPDAPTPPTYFGFPFD